MLWQPVWQARKNIARGGAFQWHELLSESAAEIAANSHRRLHIIGAWSRVVRGRAERAPFWRLDTTQEVGAHVASRPERPWRAVSGCDRPLPLACDNCAVAVARWAASHLLRPAAALFSSFFGESGRSWSARLSSLKSISPELSVSIWANSARSSSRLRPVREHAAPIRARHGSRSRPNSYRSHGRGRTFAATSHRDGGEAVRRCLPHPPRRHPRRPVDALLLGVRL